MIFPTSILLLATAAGVNAHGKLESIAGANGVKANGPAIVPGTPGTPGTGTTKVTEVDTTIFGKATAKDPAAASGCGKTPGGGKTDCATAAAASLATSGRQVPTSSSDGTLTMNFY